MKNNMVILFLFLSLSAFAEEIDVLLAKTYLALGDEVAKEAQIAHKNIQNYLSEDTNSDRSVNVDDRYEALSSKYVSLVQSAKSNYQLVSCELKDCGPETGGLGGLKLSANYNHLRREAITKIDMLLQNFSLNMNVAKYAPIYAVNANFEEELLGRLNRLVNTQIKIDSEARSLKQRLVDLENAQIGTSGEITGVDLALLKEKNYTVNSQSQLASFQSCIDNHTIEKKFESDELNKTIAQFNILRNNTQSHFEKTFDTPIDTGEGKIFSVQANAGWQNTEISLSEKDQMFFSTQGEWVVKGAITDYAEGDFNTSSKNFFGWFQRLIQPLVVGVVNGTLFGDVENSIDDLAKLDFAAKVHETMRLNNFFKFSTIKSGLKKANGAGYSISFSNGIGASSGTGSSSGGSMGLSFGPLNIGRSESDSTSKGTSNSAGFSGSFGLNLSTNVMTDAPTGALIGSYCEVAPSTVSTCPYFLIGISNISTIPDGIPAGTTLWVMANDKISNMASNTGSLQLSIRRRSTFKTSWDKYEQWLSSTACSENERYCGLDDILSNIAYIPNPAQAAKASFVRANPDIPIQARDLILEEINYLIELQVISRNIKSRELSSELHDTKTLHCESQLKLSKEKIENTNESIKMYRQLAKSKERSIILLDRSSSFYEGELAGINQVREKNLQRIRRYFDLTVNAYNYLYLDNFTVSGELIDYREGEMYAENIETMRDLIIEITAVNDLMNENKGFVIYELSKDELSKLTNPDFRKRKLMIDIDLNEQMCRGFNLNDQSRIMIEKVGVLLDINPEKEHLFFKNNHKRGTKVSLVHGSSNFFYDYFGRFIEYWIPSQKRSINALSSRVLVDANSDYAELRNSRYFQRLSFRKTSFATSWRLEMLDPAITMYDGENVLLEGVKLVFWYNSTETQLDDPINKCIVAPANLAVMNNAGKPNITFTLDKTDEDFATTAIFYIYRSESPDKGFKKVKTLDPTDESSCLLSGNTLTCTSDDYETEGTNVSSGKTYYYKVRAGSLHDPSSHTYMPGLESEAVSFTVP